MTLQNKRYSILAGLQASVGGITAVSIGLIYVLRPESLGANSVSIAIASVGAITVIYYFTLHLLLCRRHPRLSAVTLSLLSVINVLLLVVSTGGLDSPYYSLWLLAIVIAGFFGMIATAIIAGLTLAYYAYEFFAAGFNQGYIVAHLAQLGISIATAIIAEIIHINIRHGSTPEQMAHLSGQLSEANLKSEALMNSVGDGVVVVNKDRQIEYFNPAAVAMTGWDPGSAQSIDYRLVLNLHTSDGKKVEDKEDPFLICWQNNKNMIREDLIIETKGGHKVEISISVSPIIDNNKQITGGIGLFRDISSEKEVDRQRDEFISTASHEMRTPVAAIEGYLSLTMNPAVATIDARAKGYLEKAHTSTQHLGQLFRDLLSITKLEDSGKVDSVEIIDLTQLIKEVVADMQFAAQKKGLEIQFGMGGGAVRGEKAVMPIYKVKANPQRLREVTMNLIENAIKFTPEGRISVTIGGTEESVTVSVTDTGVGISAEDIPHLFQKFYRIDNSATRTIGGTGLGLYLCRTIIELFNGRIWVESRFGDGSSFKFSLPRLKNDVVLIQTTAPVIGQPNPVPVPGSMADPNIGAIPAPPAVQSPVTASTPATTQITAPVATSAVSTTPAENTV